MAWIVLVAIAGLNAYQAVVLLVPYRRLEPWAWWLTWVSVAAFALVFPLTDPELGLFYLGAAVVSALAQAITFREASSDRT
jgi:hypothetical protein